MIPNVQIVPKLRECKGMQSKSLHFLFLLYNAGELKKMLKKKKKKKKKKTHSVMRSPLTRLVTWSITTPWKDPSQTERVSG